jgi:predicted SAM-dependent methyltransferase
MTKRYLNLGCGERFHAEWVNLDLHPASPSVQKWDLQKDLPFPDGSFDVVYHSHVLEHFSRVDGIQLLARCLRLLKPSGVIRVVVPDLERIARQYLESLDKSLAGDAESQQRYDWIVLEMYDQALRETSGGQMLEYLRQAGPGQIEFVRKRHGTEIDRILDAVRGKPQAKSYAGSFVGRTRSLAGRKLLRLLLGAQGLAAYDCGRFRLSGEIHKWMYDRYSLGRILQGAGFVNPEIFGPAESQIPNWASFALDTEPDGRVYKPDSLFVEAVRP